MRRYLSPAAADSVAKLLQLPLPHLESVGGFWRQSFKLVSNETVEFHDDGLSQIEHNARLPVHPSHLQVPDHGAEAVREVDRCRGLVSGVSVGDDILQVLLLEEESDELAPKAGRNRR